MLQLACPFFFFFFFLQGRFIFFMNDNIFQGNLRSWLLNKDCYDQFSVIYDAGEKTAIFVNSAEPAKVEERAVSLPQGLVFHWLAEHSDNDVKLQVPSCSGWKNEIYVVVVKTLTEVSGLMGHWNPVTNKTNLDQAGGVRCHSQTLTVQVIQAGCILCTAQFLATQLRKTIHLWTQAVCNSHSCHRTETISVLTWVNTVYYFVMFSLSLWNSLYIWHFCCG